MPAQQITNPQPSGLYAGFSQPSLPGIITLELFNPLASGLTFTPGQVIQFTSGSTTFVPILESTTPNVFLAGICINTAAPGQVLEVVRQGPVAGVLNDASGATTAGQFVVASTTTAGTIKSQAAAATVGLNIGIVLVGGAASATSTIMVNIM